MMTLTKNGSALANKFMVRARRNGAHTASGQRRVQAFLSRNKVASGEQGAVAIACDEPVSEICFDMAGCESGFLLEAELEPVIQALESQDISLTSACISSEPLLAGEAKKVTLEDLLRFEDDFRPPTLEDLLNFNYDHFSI